MKQKMRPNTKELQSLVNTNFNGSKAAFATAIGMDRGQVSKIIKDGTCAGAQFFGGLMAYCEREKLNFKRYIFLPEHVINFNDPQPTGTEGGE